MGLAEQEIDKQQKYVIIFSYTGCFIHFILFYFLGEKKEEMSLCVMETGPELRALPLCVKPVECAVRVHDSLCVTLVI